MILNPDVFLGNFSAQILNKVIEKRATSCTLFILFHEITGHLKTHINNNEDSPEQIFLDDFSPLSLPDTIKPDSGFLFEFILANNIINCKYFMNSKISEELLDPKLYLGDNFNELRNKLNKIKNAIYQENKLYDKKMSKSVIESNELTENINYNYFNMSYQDFLIYFSNLDEDKKKEAEDTDAYRYFLSLYEGGKKI